MIKRFKMWLSNYVFYRSWEDKPCEHGLTCKDRIITGSHRHDKMYRYPAIYKKLDTGTPVYVEKEGYVKVNRHPLFECMECKQRFHGPKLEFIKVIPADDQ